MACFSFLAASPSVGGNVFHPRAITPAGNFVYGYTSALSVEKFTWPGLVHDSTYATATGSLVDVAIDTTGDIFHSVRSTSTTTVSVFKNGASFATLSNAGGLGGGGLAIADGWLWVLTSASSGTGSGILWRYNPATAAASVAYSVSGDRFSDRPYAATDGAVWFKRTTDTVLVRHKSGTTTTVSLVGGPNLVPRPSGVMLTPRTSAPTGYVDVDPSLAISAPSCDPTLVGASANPVSTFTDPSFTQIGLMDQSFDIYRLGAAAGMTVGFLQMRPT